jgi:DNA-binding transcriptional MerR regulator
MESDKHLTIGQLARLSGLTVKALRHYDRVGLLSPASIDRQTGYRRYGQDQLERAREIRSLRDLDVPLADIRSVLNGDAELSEVLAKQSAAVEAETYRLQRMGHRLRMSLREQEEERVMATTNDRDDVITSEDQRALAVQLFNRVWTMLEKPSRSVEDDDRMVHMAHASRYHWGEVGSPEQLAVGEWQCSRVYAVLGRGEPSLHHARRALTIAQGPGLPDWLAASAMEAMARASAVAGDESEAMRWASAAKAAADAIEDPEDREVVMGDLATLPVGAP